MGYSWGYACVVAFLVVLAGATTAGCGDSLDAAYLASSSNTVIFLQCVERNDSVDGSMTVVTLDTTGEVETHTVPVSGTVSGSDVSLALSQGLGITTSITGSLSGSGLRLNFPLDDGGIQPVDMTPSTIEDYNEAVAVLGTQAEQAANEQAVEETGDTLASDEEEVSLALSALRDDVDYLPQYLADVQSALDITKDDVRAAVDSGQVEADVGSVEAAQSALEVAANTVRGDIEQLQSAMSQLESDFATLEQMQAASPAAAGEGTPTADDIASQREEVSTAIADAQQAVDDYLEQGEQLLAEARSCIR